MVTPLPVNTRPRARCTVEGCPEPRYGKRLVCQAHAEEADGAASPAVTFSTAELYRLWGTTRHTPAVYHGRYRVYGICPQGMGFDLVLGKHAAPVWVDGSVILSTRRAPAAKTAGRQTEPA